MRILRTYSDDIVLLGNEEEFFSKEEFNSMYSDNPNLISLNTESYFKLVIKIIDKIGEVKKLEGLKKGFLSGGRDARAAFLKFYTTIHEVDEELRAHRSELRRIFLELRDAQEFLGLDQDTEKILEILSNKKARDFARKKIKRSLISSSLTKILEDFKAPH